MSTQGISALERGYQRTPQRETLALLAGALALEDEQREEFESAAARSVLLGRGASVTVGPWARGSSATLPLALSSFIGRERELDEIAALVRDHRMVTLTGSGGVGKTQTALHVATAQSSAGDFPVCFVGLAPIDNPALLVAAVASALGVQEVPDRPLLDTLAEYLKNKTLLLILDNCEHVIGEAATVAGALLAGCPRLRILATSREPLRAAGEHSYRLPSLGVPSLEATHSLGAKDAAAYAAIALFGDRARAVDHRFVLTNENAPAVARICRRLDGIPLAIELAAARLNVLPVESLAETLDDRFRILAGGERTALPRHQTMRAAIDSSYNLLSPPEQRVFERLSAFAGRCTLAAVEAVCGGEEIAPGGVFELLSSLVDKSLLAVDFERRESRYYLLESFRAYAREKLGQRGEQEVVVRRHARAYLENLERADSAWDTEGDFVWNELVYPELDNWRAALGWALVAHSDVALGQRLASASIMGLAIPAEARRWVALALDRVDERTPAILLARINYASAVIACNLFETEIELTSSEKALVLYREVGDAFGIALSRVQLGDALRRLGRSEEAEQTLREALTQLRQLGVPKRLAYALRVMGSVCRANGDLTGARSHVAEAIAIYNALGAQRMTAFTIADDLAEIELGAGNAGLARQYLSDALPILRTFDDGMPAAMALNTMSACCVALADYDEAESYPRESFVFSSESHSSAHGAYALQRLAAVAALRPQGASEHVAEAHEHAARLFGFVDARLAAFGSPREFHNRHEYERVLAVLFGAMASDRVACLMQAGAAMSEEEAFEQARADDR